MVVSHNGANNIYKVALNLGKYSYRYFSFFERFFEKATIIQRNIPLTFDITYLVVKSTLRARLLQIFWPSQNISILQYFVTWIKQRKMLWGWLNLKNNKSNSWQLLHNSSLMEFHDHLTNLLSFILCTLYNYSWILKNKYLIPRVSGASMVMTVNFWWWKT